MDEELGEAFTADPFPINVYLSNTTVDPRQMSLTFDENHGRDFTNVYGGNLTLSSAGGGAFDIVIDLQTRLLYHGRDNLLVEYRVEGHPHTALFDSAGSGRSARTRRGDERRAMTGV